MKRIENTLSRPDGAEWIRQTLRSNLIPLQPRPKRLIFFKVSRRFTHASVLSLMDFLLWAARSLHIFGVVVWFGGLLYQAAVLFPVVTFEGKELSDLHRHFIRRFQPFVWMCVWTVLVTGVALTLFNPRFVFFQFEDRWSVLLGFKQVVFACMVFFSIGHARMFSLIDELMGKGETADHVAPFFRQMVLFGKLNIGLAIVTLGLAAALMS